MGLRGCRSSTARYRIRVWGRLCAVLTVGLFGACWWLGGEIAEPVNRTVPFPTSGAFNDLQLVEQHFQSDSGSLIAAWRAKHPTATCTVILAHPIRGDRRSMLTRAKLLYSHGYSVMLIDLQAHGESLGEKITMGHLEAHDVRGAVQFVRDTSPDHRIAVLGRSLGGAAALLASPLGIDALVLESVYPTIGEATFNRLSRRIGPLSHVVAPLLTAQLPARLGISPTQLRPIDHLAQVGCPVLLMSGTLDERTTAEETRAMFVAAQEPKELVLFPTARHVDLYSNDPRLFGRTVLTFLENSLYVAQP